MLKCHFMTRKELKLAGRVLQQINDMSAESNHSRTLDILMQRNKKSEYYFVVCLISFIFAQTIGSPCVVIKRESGASPEQSRCCKLQLLRVSNMPLCIIGKAPTRAVSQKTCHCSFIHLLRGKAFEKHYINF